MEAYQEHLAQGIGTRFEQQAARLCREPGMLRLAHGLASHFVHFQEGSAPRCQGFAPRFFQAHRKAGMLHRRKDRERRTLCECGASHLSVRAGGEPTLTEYPAAHHLPLQAPIWLPRPTALHVEFLLLRPLKCIIALDHRLPRPVRDPGHVPDPIGIHRNFGKL